MGGKVVRRKAVSPLKVLRARALRREMTAAEKMLWSVLRGHGLAGLRFRRQHVVAGYIVDFYCAAQRLVIEVDGEIHDAQRAQDLARTRVLERRGLRVMRVTNEQVLFNLQSTLDLILQACTEHP